METKEFIIKVIEKSGSPMKSAQIAEEIGIEKKEVDKAIKALVKEEKLHSPKFCFYDLKK
ncbi:MAG: MarR family transcriptional regulator [Bacteroidales bacterium]|nr:MarR family transcriptional regulator [Bacteroidales bacterium]